MKKIHCLIFLLTFLLVSFSQLGAAGLKVSPAGFILRNVIPGEEYNIKQETGVQFTIENNDTGSHTYLLSLHRPSECGKWEKGYLEIPDPKWCWFDSNEITIAANSKGYANLYLKIPDEEKYYNQHWIVTLGITGKPGPGGGGIALAINIRVQIETGSRTDLKGKPDGLIGVVPATITLKDGKGEVAIFNNSDTTQTYKIYPLAEKEKLERTYLSAGFKPLPETKWLKINPTWFGTNSPTLKIPPGGSKTFRVELLTPQSERRPGEKWESIIFIEGKENTGFLRVQIVGEK